METFWALAHFGAHFLILKRPRTKLLLCQKTFSCDKKSSFLPFSFRMTLTKKEIILPGTRKRKEAKVDQNLPFLFLQRGIVNNFPPQSRWQSQKGKERKRNDKTGNNLFLRHSVVKKGREYVETTKPEEGNSISRLHRAEKGKKTTSSCCCHAGLCTVQMVTCCWQCNRDAFGGDLILPRGLQGTKMSFSWHWSRCFWRWCILLLTR